MDRPKDQAIAWRAVPGARVRLRLALDRPRVLDGQTGTVRYCWPYVANGYPWLVALDTPAVDGRRVYTLVMCADSELEPTEDVVKRSPAIPRRLLTSISRRILPSRRPDGRDPGADVRALAPLDAVDADRRARGISESAPPAARPALARAAEVITYRRPSEFVGRAKEITYFDENLTLPLEDERRRFIFDVVGPSGVGKTWLLRRFGESFKRHGGTTAGSDAADGDVVEVMAHIAAQLDSGTAAFTAFDAELRRFRQRWQQPLEKSIESISRGISTDDAFDDPQLSATHADRELVAGTVASDPMRGSDVASASTPSFEPLSPKTHLPPLGSTAPVASGARASVDLLLADLEPRIASIVDPEPMREAIRRLTPLFVAGLRHTAMRRPVCLIFDDHDHTRAHLDEWLTTILDGQFGDLPGSTSIVIAGQNALDAQQWSEYAPVIGSLPLGPFTENETRAFLLQQWILDERVVRTIGQVSGRLPVLVATMAVRASDHLERLVEPDRSSLDCFLSSLGDPARQTFAADAALPRFLDVDVLTVIADEPDARPLVEWLRKMPFVERQGPSWTYRQAVRDVLVGYCRQERRQRWLQVHERLAIYYEHLGHTLHRDPASRLRDSTWQRYDQEALYHRLCENPIIYRPLALNGFIGRFGGGRTLARRWAETIFQAGHDTGDGSIRRWGERLIGAVVALDEGRFGVVATELGALLSTDELDAWSRKQALSWRARMLLADAQYEAALEAYAELLEFSPNDPVAHQENGAALLRLGRHQEARVSFENALRLDPENALAQAGRLQADRRTGEAPAPPDQDRPAQPHPGDPLGNDLRGQLQRALERYQAAPTPVA